MGLVRGLHIKAWKGGAKRTHPSFIRRAGKGALRAAKNLEAGKEMDIATGKVVEDEVR